jgi:hypothetical protein
MATVWMSQEHSIYRGLIELDDQSRGNAQHACNSKSRRGQKRTRNAKQNVEYAKKRKRNGKSGENNGFTDEDAEWRE